MTPGNETKEMFPFIPLILSKVNSYEDSVSGKFKSPVPSLGLLVCCFFYSWLNTRACFSIQNTHFFEQAQQPTDTCDSLMGIIGQRRKSKFTIHTFIWLNTDINKSCKDLFINSIVNSAIHSHLHFVLHVKTAPGQS